MKPDWSHLEQFRVRTGVMGSGPNNTGGAFFVPCGTTKLVIIASSGDASIGINWEHVSARAENHRGQRQPTWAEMCFAKDLFWADDECVVQYHPPKSDYVNQHPFVLHLWRPTVEALPRPPSIAVGIKS